MYLVGTVEVIIVDIDLNLQAYVWCYVHYFFMSDMSLLSPTALLEVQYIF